MDKSYKYMFSVIMPIYNVEKYLHEAIDSIVNQTIGFCGNIQLILVSDGSTDGSDLICQEYQTKYPNNVVYIRQQNQGVSAARNAGMPYIEGKYVNFFDSDDKWELDAFEKVWLFFEQHNNEIDIVCCKEVFFEAKTGEHSLNNKFKKGSRVININRDPHFILLSVKSTFIKAEVACLEQYDTRITIGEDAKYLTQLILRREKFGVFKGTHYNFRKRDAGTSITQTPNISRYVETMQLYYKFLLDYSEEKYGHILPYIQHVVINGLKYRVLGSRQNNMTEEQWNEYINVVTSLIMRIDDEVIATTNNISVFAKAYILKLKHKVNVKEMLYMSGETIYFNDVALAKVSKKFVKIESIKDSWKKRRIDGSVRIPMNDNIGIYFKEKGNYHRIETSIDENSNRDTFDGCGFTRRYKFKATLKKQNGNMALYLGGNGNYVEIDLGFGPRK